MDCGDLVRNLEGIEAGTLAMGEAMHTAMNSPWDKGINSLAHDQLKELVQEALELAREKSL